ncbi:hypothetical protein [Acanthamoeba castellanii mimivirus]|uniref:Uncharacterized protein R358 n=6 Tax=Mimivirus TaxID=315393 RepID=YR358_MIMIV|nr:hypothetical protein MIMI_gp0388 [Acanthamoeba polyphaga mimivirus]Q5UQU7.1 RecName: Full=Uncharacterized protein R358 [Acanthamoeba polyphaga mimivirus]AEQ60547.1 hypothetical protein [Acanthamoeba castellanii mamavirus]AHA45505.1 hypothetical protein HIRU_S599 [Hirudovirus strain Sangsue]ALR83938.1 hypothetical protein [Niemeyer virus]AMZ02803.1 hypothetical protein [Mimivirus Bombay]EJN40798.1 hypothetical protein lvs_R294 [Acanthamoeba polyphaga lentillevirus]BAV61460.1 hypothetical p
MNIFIRKHMIPYLSEYTQMFIVLFGAKVVVCDDTYNFQQFLEHKNNLNLFYKTFPPHIENAIPQILQHNIKIYLVNIDQLGWRNLNTVKKALSNKIKVIDYSSENISLTKDINHVHIPLLLYNDIIIRDNLEIKYDIGFSGGDFPRRSTILKQLSNKYNVININKFGKKRDILTKQCRIVLNIHAFDSLSTTETLRCYPLIYNKILTVSENTPLIESSTYGTEINKFIVFVDYDKIVSKCEEILSNYDQYYNSVFKDFDETKIKHMVDNHIETINQNIFN